MAMPLSREFGGESYEMKAPVSDPTAGEYMSVQMAASASELTMQANVLIAFTQAAARTTMQARQLHGG